VSIDRSSKFHLKVRDFSVSGEEFQLIENKEHGFLETIPQPDLDMLPGYYESEDYISHTDSKRNLFEKVYHLVREVSLRKKLKLINFYTSRSKKLLDVGCGTGDFIKSAQLNGWSVSGIEPNKDARDIANRKTNNCVLREEGLYEFQSNSFDVVTLWHVLEHLPNLEEQLKAFKNVLKQDGILVVAVPNYRSFDANYYKEFWAAYDVPRHLWHFNKESISSLVGKQNMKVVEIKPMLFDSFYVSMLSEKYKKGKMNPIKGFWNGLRSNMAYLSTKEASSLIYVIKNN
jgi:2-polyprenyl-3-methyl-5-hydroxy-6-metoxy-1,4-benzoquinol methylase